MFDDSIYDENEDEDKENISCATSDSLLELQRCSKLLNLDSNSQPENQSSSNRNLFSEIDDLKEDATPEPALVDLDFFFNDKGLLSFAKEVKLNFWICRAASLPRKQIAFAERAEFALHKWRLRCGCVEISG